MCAINGIITTGRSPEEQERDRVLVEAMNAATAHRGPDATNVWSDSCATLGHNRLSIIDLSPDANQPMLSASGRYALVFNGEIYNFQELRTELTEYPFKTQSDSEVILAAYEEWGEECFGKFRGMFALGIWDTEEQKLILARDQSGIKPLLWRQEGTRVHFSSELKGLLADASLARVMDREALEAYLRLRYVPEPLTLVRGVHKLPAGSVAVIKSGVVTLRPYDRVALKPLLQESKDTILKQVQSLVDQAVRMELISDRPVGLFLSGGLDSSIVLDAATRAAGVVETYSLRFEVGEDEQPEKFNADADLAERTAKHYSTNHHEILFSEKAFVEALPEVTRLMDQPVGNATALAQFHLAREARKHIVVALMGEGGDELFGGYPRYRTSRLMDYYQKLPSALRRMLATLSARAKLANLSGVDRIAQFMFEKEPQLRRAVRAEFVSDAPLKRFAQQYLQGRDAADPTQLFMDADRRSWLIDEALLRTDSMTMASALEARVPLLNRDLIGYASRIPTALRQNKSILREAFKDRLPAHVLEAKKRGFFSPIAKWLRRPALQKLSREALAKGFHPGTDALLNFAELEGLFDAHIEGRGYAAPLIWSLVTLRLWAKEHQINLQ